MSSFEPRSKAQRIHLAVIGLAIAGAVGVLIGATSAAAEAASESSEAVLERGEYLIHVGQCHDCHTALMMGPQGPERDMARRLSGHPAELPLDPVPEVSPESPWNFVGYATSTAFVGPWGVSVARNLTPDDETGLGRWSEEQFVRSMREGLHQGQVGGRPILPPMPWENVGKMSEEDLHAVWVYLRSIPAIHNEAPQSRPAPPPGHEGH